MRAGVTAVLRVMVEAFENADLPVGAFDLAASATAFHWVRPEVALPKLARVLRPGGRVSCAVFGAPDRNAWVAIPSDVLRARGHMPRPEAGGPGILALADPDRLRRLAPIFTDLRLRTRLPADLPLVDADYAQVERVFTNLLANAARHAPSGTDVWIVAKPDGDSVRVEVSDRGKGVPDDEADRIFEPFQRGDGSRSSGIGLAICKAIVEGHGGQIWVERTFGGGATFAFTLPTAGGEP